MNELINKLKNKLIVSCQAHEGEPLYKPEGQIMCLMAKAAVLGGAVAIRAEGLVDIPQIQKVVDVPIIGIYKKKHKGFDGYITITMDEVDALAELGVEIIAVDATQLKRGDGKSTSQYIKEIKHKYPDILIMADCSTLEEGIEAEKGGADFIGTTMSGYTPYTQHISRPNFMLIEDLAKVCKKPIIAEGGFSTAEEVKKALRLGAHSVVIGGAITRPHEITKKIVDSLE